MDLSNFSLEKETSTEMHVKHPSGKTLVLDKASMSDKAKSLVKKMACGGSVKGYYDGETVEDTSHVYGADDVDNKIAQEKQHAKDVTSQNTDASKDTTDVKTDDQKARAKEAAATYGYAQGGKIPHYYDGTGSVGENSVLAAPPQQNPIDLATQVSLPNPDAPQAALSQPPPQQAAQDPMIQSKMSQNDLLNRGIKNLDALGTAQQGAAGQANKAYGEYEDASEDLLSPNELMEDHMRKNEELGKAYMENKLDPDRYWNNQSTASKIGAGISMVIGGLSSGLTGKDNPALTYFNRAIDQDIDAQKNEQGKKLNLWKMNKEAMGDEMRANLATQNQLYTGLQAKLAKASAGVQAPEAKFHIQQMQDQLEQQKIGNTQRLGLLTQGQGPSGQGLSSADPLQIATDPNIVPADRQKEVIDQIGKAQYVSKNAVQLRALYDQAEKEQSIASRAGRLGFESPALKSLKLLAVPLLKDNDGRVNEAAVQSFNESLPGTFEKQSTTDTLRSGFNNFIKMHQEAPAAKAYGLDPERFKSTSTSPQASFSPQEQQYYNWAKANPSDPKAQAVFKKLGVK